MMTPKAADTFWQDAIKLNLYYSGMAADVLRFMAAFEQPVIHNDAEITPSDFRLAEKLMAEEIKGMWIGFNKFSQAATLENKAEFVDGAIDTIYVVLWSLLKLGVPVDAVFEEVQRSNMAKLQPDGTCLKNEAGKVQKPADWTPPNIHQILVDHQVAGVYQGGFRD